MIECRYINMEPNMKKLFVLSVIFLFGISETFAYAIKVYDEYGSRIGTYRKEGDNFVLYDFNDNKVENPASLIKNVPGQKTLSEYTRTFYDENMMPIGTFRSGLYGNNGKYYPRGIFYPSSWNSLGTPSVVCPRANNTIKNNYHSGTVFVDTRFPQLHKF